MSLWDGPVTLWKGSVRLSSWATIMRKPPIQHWSHMMLERTEQTWLEHHQNKSPAVHQRQLGICLLYSLGFPDHVFFNLTYPGLKGRRVKHQFKTKVTSIDKLSNNLLSQPNLRYVLSRYLKNEEPSREHSEKIWKIETIKKINRTWTWGTWGDTKFSDTPMCKHCHGRFPYKRRTSTNMSDWFLDLSKHHTSYLDKPDRFLLIMFSFFYFFICAVFARFWISFLAVPIPNLNGDHLGRIAVLNPTIFGKWICSVPQWGKLRNSPSKYCNIFTSHWLHSPFDLSIFLSITSGFSYHCPEKIHENPSNAFPPPPLAQLPRKLAQRLRWGPVTAVPATPRRKRSCGASRDFSGPGWPLGEATGKRKPWHFC